MIHISLTQRFLFGTTYYLVKFKRDEKVSWIFTSLNKANVGFIQSFKIEVLKFRYLHYLVIVFATN